MTRTKINTVGRKKNWRGGGGGWGSNFVKNKIIINKAEKKNNNKESTHFSEKIATDNKINLHCGERRAQTPAGHRCVPWIFCLSKKKKTIRRTNRKQKTKNKKQKTNQNTTAANIYDTVEFIRPGQREQLRRR